MGSYGCWCLYWEVVEVVVVVEVVIWHWSRFCNSNNSMTFQRNTEVVARNNCTLTTWQAKEKCSVIHCKKTK